MKQKYLNSIKRNTIGGSEGKKRVNYLSGAQLSDFLSVVLYSKMIYVQSQNGAGPSVTYLGYFLFFFLNIEPTFLIHGVHCMDNKCRFYRKVSFAHALGVYPSAK